MTEGMNGVIGTGNGDVQESLIPERQDPVQHQVPDSLLDMARDVHLYDQIDFNDDQIEAVLGEDDDDDLIIEN